MKLGEERQLLAVYGTLKRGLNNAHWMQGSVYVGTDVMDRITLYDLGPYPGARLEPSAGVLVEIYAVTEAQLRHVDILEDYQAEAPQLGMYDRLRLPTRYGDAWVYVYNRAVDPATAFREGSWQPRHGIAETEDAERS